MGLYKGIEIPDELMGVIDQMKALDQDREELSVLSQQWDLLTILGQMTGSGTDMTKTREGFKNLTAKLLSALGAETLHKSVQSLTGKAQVTVDIVIRNLFERTADIGFLATDDDIRAFVNLLSGPTSPEQVAEKAQQLRHRFAEYVQKYSVYENIILLDPEGKLLCQLDPENKIVESDPAIVQAVLDTSKEYVETFSKTTLCPGRENALLYSFRVRENADPKSKTVGVLCLVFRFENEMESVFGNLLTPEDWTVLTLLDETGRVIATSDPVQIPVGSKQALAVDQEFKLTKFGGRLYLAKTCATKGYQGFKGLGWYGHAMIPLEQAFAQSPSESESKIDGHVLESVMEEPRLFSEQIRAIPKDAESIQSELDRAVWNGNLSVQTTAAAGSSSGKVLLWEISVTGSKTKNVFERSINVLHQTVVNSILTDVRFVASLAIDIMDRNLYERANDCRWWALTTSFKEILSKGEHSKEEMERIHKVLAYINGLYTVYTNLFVFDQHGKILAVSNSSESHLVGKVLADDFSRSVLSSRSSQKYKVSSFQKSDFYGQRHTYIYGAPITDESGHKTVGGIGIVFDGEPQFRQMLEDSLPRDKNGLVPEGCFSVFVDRQGVIVSATARQLNVGGTLDIPNQFLNLKNGEHHSSIIEWNGQFYAVGACCSKGYREYKDGSDEYKNDVIALTFMALGKVKEKRNTQDRDIDKRFTLRHAPRVPGVEYVDIATFHVGSVWIGIRTESIQAAMIADKVTPIPALNKAVRGAITFDQKPIYLLDAHGPLGVTDVVKAQQPQVVVVKTESGLVGIAVDRLGEIPYVPEKQISVSGLLIDDNSKYVQGIIRLESDNPHAPMLVVVEPTEFVKCLVGGGMGGADVISRMGDLQLPGPPEPEIKKAS